MSFLSILIERYIINTLFKYFDNAKERNIRLNIQNPRLGLYELNDIKINNDVFENIFEPLQLSFNWINKLVIEIDSSDNNILDNPKINIRFNGVYIIINNITRNRSKTIDEIDAKLKFLTMIRQEMSKAWKYQRNTEYVLSKNAFLFDALLKMITVQIDDFYLVVFNSDLNFPNLCIFFKHFLFKDGNEHDSKSKEATTTTHNDGSTTTTNYYYDIMKDLEINNLFCVQALKLKHDVFLSNDVYYDAQTVMTRIKDLFIKDIITIEQPQAQPQSQPQQSQPQQSQPQQSQSQQSQPQQSQPQQSQPQQFQPQQSQFQQQQQQQQQPSFHQRQLSTELPFPTNSMRMPKIPSLINAVSGLDSIKYQIQIYDNMSISNASSSSPPSRKLSIVQNAMGNNNNNNNLIINVMNGNGNGASGGSGGGASGGGGGGSTLVTPTNKNNNTTTNNNNTNTGNVNPIFPNYSRSYHITQILAPCNIKLRGIFSRSKMENLKYKIALDLDITNIKINLTYTSLINLIPFANDLIKKTYQCIMSDKIHDIELNKLIESAEFNTMIRNNQKMDNIKRFIEIFSKIDKLVKRKNILYNKLYNERMSYKLSLQIIQELFDDKKDYYDFFNLLKDMDINMILYGIFVFITKSLDMTTSEKYQPLSGIFLFKYLDLDCFDEELVLFKTEIQEKLYDMPVNESSIGSSNGNAKDKVIAIDVNLRVAIDDTVITIISDKITDAIINIKSCLFFCNSSLNKLDLDVKSPYIILQLAKESFKTSTADNQSMTSSMNSKFNMSKNFGFLSDFNEEPEMVNFCLESLTYESRSSSPMVIIETSGEADHQVDKQNQASFMEETRAREYRLGSTSGNSNWLGKYWLLHNNVKKLLISPFPFQSPNKVVQDKNKASENYDEDIIKHLKNLNSIFESELNSKDNSSVYNSILKIKKIYLMRKTNFLYKKAAASGANLGMNMNTGSNNTNNISNGNVGGISEMSPKSMQQSPHFQTNNDIKNNPEMNNKVNGSNGGGNGNGSGGNGSANGNIDAESKNTNTSDDLNTKSKATYSNNTNNENYIPLISDNSIEIEVKFTKFKGNSHHHYSANTNSATMENNGKMVITINDLDIIAKNNIIYTKLEWLDVLYMINKIIYIYDTHVSYLTILQINPMIINKFYDTIKNLLNNKQCGIIVMCNQFNRYNNYNSSSSGAGNNNNNEYGQYTDDNANLLPEEDCQFNHESIFVMANDVQILFNKEIIIPDQPIGSGNSNNQEPNTPKDNVKFDSSHYIKIDLGNVNHEYLLYTETNNTNNNGVISFYNESNYYGNTIGTNASGGGNGNNNNNYSMNSNPSPELKKNSQNRVQKFQIVFKQCVLYYNFHKIQIRLSNTFDFRLDYFRQPFEIGLSDIEILVSPIKIIVNEIIQGFITSIFENMNKQLPSNKLNVIGGYSLKFEKIDTIITDFETLTPSIQMELFMLDFSKKFKYDTKIKYTISIHSMNIYEFKDLDMDNIVKSSFIGNFIKPQIISRQSQEYSDLMNFGFRTELLDPFGESSTTKATNATEAGATNTNTNNNTGQIPRPEGRTDSILYMTNVFNALDELIESHLFVESPVIVFSRTAIAKIDNSFGDNVIYRGIAYLNQTLMNPTVCLDMSIHIKDALILIPSKQIFGQDSEKLFGIQFKVDISQETCNFSLKHRGSNTTTILSNNGNNFNNQIEQFNLSYVSIPSATKIPSSSSHFKIDIQGFQCFLSNYTELDQMLKGSSTFKRRMILIGSDTRIKLEKNIEITESKEKSVSELIKYIVTINGLGLKAQIGILDLMLLWKTLNHELNDSREDLIKLQQRKLDVMLKRKLFHKQYGNKITSTNNKKNFSQDQHRQLSNNLIKKTQSIVFIDTLSTTFDMTLMNDIPNEYALLYKICLNMKNMTLSSLIDNFSYHFKVSLDIKYMNKYSNSWEPFMESIEVIGAYGLITIDNLTKYTFTLLLNEVINKSMEIILSEEQIVEIMQCYNKIKELFEDEKEVGYNQGHDAQNATEVKPRKSLLSETIDIITSIYIIENYTGLDLIIESRTNKENSIVICKNECKQWVDNIVINMLQEEVNDNDGVMIKFKGMETTIDNITNIDLGNIDITKKYYLTVKIDNKIIKDKYYLIYMSKRDQSNQKIITISSNQILENHLDYPLYVMLADSFSTQEYEIKTRSKFGIPYFLQESSIGIRLSQDAEELHMLAELAHLFEANQEELESIKIKDNNFSIQNIRYENESINALIIKPVFTLKNCLPFHIEVNISSKKPEEKASMTQILLPQQVISHKFFNPLDIKVKFRVYGSSWSEEEMLVKDANLIRKTQAKHDKQNARNVEIMNIATKKVYMLKLAIMKKYSCYIYCETFLNDETNLNMLYFTLKENKKHDFYLIPTQTQQLVETLPKNHALLLDNEEKFIILARRDSLDDKTEQFNIENVGYTRGNLINKGFKKVYDFGISVKNVIVDAQYTIKSRMITTFPSYILINNTKYNIIINQESCLGPGIKLDSRSRSSLWFEIPAKEKKIILKIVDKGTNKEITSWSGGINVDNLNTINLVLRKLENLGIFVIFNICIKKKCNANYIVFNEESTNALLKIKNSIPFLDLIIYQSCMNEEYSIILRSGEIMSFGWDQPEKKKELIIMPINPEYKFNSKVFNFERKIETSVKNITKPANEIRIFSDIFFEDQAKVLDLKMGSVNKKNSISEGDLNIETNYSIIINRIGISFLSRAKNIRNEILYVLLDRIRADYHCDDLVKSYEFKLKSINIDNNLRKDCPHPSMLRPNLGEELYKSDKYSLEILAQKPNNTRSENSQVIHYELVAINIWNFLLKLDSMFIDQLYLLKNNIKSLYDYSNKKRNSISIKKILFDDKYTNLTLNLKNYMKYKQFCNIDKPKRNLWIEELLISPIQLNLLYTIISRVNKQNHLYFNIDPNLFDIRTQNSTSFKIEVKGYRCLDLDNNLNTVLNALYNKYLHNITSVIKANIKQYEFKPSHDNNLLENICSGYNEIKDRGGLFGNSILKRNKKIGSRSFVSSSEAFINLPIHKILIALAEIGKSHYEKRKQCIISDKIDPFKSPKLNTSSNTQVGYCPPVAAKQASQLEKREVSDIWDKSNYPEMISAIMIKLIEFYLDTKNKEHPKNTNIILQMNNEKNYYEQRLRYCRIFYGLKCQAKNYVEEDCKLISCLTSIDKKKYENLPFVELFYVIIKGDKNKTILLLFINHLLLYNDIQNKILWRNDLSKIDKVKKIGKQIYMSYSIKKDEYRVEENHIILELFEDKIMPNGQNYQDYVIDLIIQYKSVSRNSFLL